MCGCRNYRNDYRTLASPRRNTCGLSLSHRTDREVCPLSARSGSPGTITAFVGKQAALIGLDQPPATSTVACAKACGASCGRLWPMPPLMVRCSYLPVNFFA